MGFTRNIASDRAVLGRLLERLELPPSVNSPLLAHAAMIRTANERLGLVSPNDVGSIVRRHTADSLLFALVRRPGPGERWADVGSGAGFPGLVLAASFPETSFTLSEPLRKRAGFLEASAAELGLQNVDITTGRAEELPSGFDVAVARALAEAGRAITELAKLTRPGGSVIVAAGAGGRQIPGASTVRLADLGNVDSPGVFFMMTNEG